MTIYDPDPKLQLVFDDTYAQLPSINWRHWLDITDIREFETLTLQLSGLTSLENDLNHNRKNSSQSITTIEDPSQLAS